MFRQLIFYVLIALALIVGVVGPSLYYVLAAGASLEWMFASLLASNVPSVVATLMIVVLVLFRTQILGAPRRH